MLFKSCVLLLTEWCAITWSNSSVAQQISNQPCKLTSVSLMQVTLTAGTNAIRLNLICQTYPT